MLPFNVCPFEMQQQEGAWSVVTDTQDGAPESSTMMVDMPAEVAEPRLEPVMMAGVTESLSAQSVGEPEEEIMGLLTCLLYTSPSPRDKRQSRMPSSA